MTNRSVDWPAILKHPDDPELGYVGDQFERDGSDNDAQQTKLPCSGFGLWAVKSV